MCKKNDNSIKTLNQRYRKYLLILKRLKKDIDLKIIDTHVHPLDVMGVVHESEYTKLHDSRFLVHDFSKPQLIERLKFGYIVNLIGHAYCKMFPGLVNGEIREKYMNMSNRRLLAEMDLSLVDFSTLVPIEPWTKTSFMCENFRDSRFIKLGSVDVGRLSVDDVKPTIEFMVSKYGIKGLKLHPNLQNFWPVPDQNGKEMSEKLDAIYRECEARRLYILFHGGTTFYTESINRRFKYLQRSKYRAILSNFFFKGMRKSLFSRYNINFVIAHMGHYGLSRVDVDLLKRLKAESKNVYFDTAGTSPAVIGKVLRVVGSKRVIFGSDAIYNRQLFSLLFVCEAIDKMYNGDNAIEALENIFYKNYFNSILK